MVKRFPGGKSMSQWTLSQLTRDWWCLLLYWSCPWCLSPGSFSGCEHGMRRLQWDAQKPWWPRWEEAQQLSLRLGLFWDYQSPKYQGYWSSTIRFFDIHLHSCMCQEEHGVCFSVEFFSFISLSSPSTLYKCRHCKPCVLFFSWDQSSKVNWGMKYVLSP